MRNREVEDRRERRELSLQFQLWNPRAVNEKRESDLGETGGKGMAQGVTQVVSVQEEIWWGKKILRVRRS